MSVLEYARAHGIATDYITAFEPLAVIQDLQRKHDTDLIQDRHLTQLNLPECSFHERLTVDKDAAMVLAAVSMIGTKTKEMEDILSSQLDFQSAKKFRVELPLLKSDHEHDCNAYTKRRQIRLEEIHLPPEILDKEKDESIEWSQQALSLPASMLQKMEHETLVVSKTTLGDLVHYLNDDWNNEDEGAIRDLALPYKRNKCLVPLTPPLSPCRSPQEPYIPSSPTAALPLLSDPTTLLSDDINAAYSTLFNQERLDGPVVQHGSSDTVAGDKFEGSKYSPSYFMKESSIDCPSPPAKYKSLRVEVPLTPLPLVPAPADDIIPSHTEMHELLTSLKIANGEDWQKDEDHLDGMFEEAFAITDTEVMNRLEQEQLQEADTTKRVKVPILDSSLPNAPWKMVQKFGAKQQSQAQINDASELFDTYGKPHKATTTHGLNDNLRWLPILSNYGVDMTAEIIGTDEDVQAYLESMGDDGIFTSNELTWKPASSKRLSHEDDEDEDELQPGIFTAPQVQDLTALIKTRKRRILEESQSGDVPASPLDPQAQSILQVGELQEKLTNQALSTVRRNERGIEPDIENQFPMTFSIDSAIDNFMETRGEKKRKLSDSTYFNENPKRADRSQPDLVSKTECTKPSTLGSMEHLLSIPAASVLKGPTPIIISTSMLKSRKLVRNIANLLPALIMVERDFTVHDSVGWNAGSVSRSPKVSLLATEADMILSPRTGVIFTTLQKVKQKPLPGQKTVSGIRQRLELVCPRYELMILVVASSENDDDAARCTVLDSSDALALTSLQGFCASLTTVIQVHYLPAPTSSSQFAKYLAALITWEARIGELLTDETIWELFLRRAGLNALAAQCVLVQLKAPDESGIGSPTYGGAFGLTAFVEMDELARRRRFGEMLGGVNVLARVGQVLNATFAKQR